MEKLFKPYKMKTTSNNLKNIHKAIERGDFRDCYLVYNRKSTDEPNNQKNSIQYQKAENSRFAESEKLHVAPVTIEGFCLDGVVSERHSGFKEGDNLVITDEGLVQYKIDRPKFRQLLQHLSRGHFKGIICLCWDRISRNKGDDTIVRKLMRKGVDVRFVYANYDQSSAGELHMDIDGMFAQHHSRVTSEKVKLTTKNLRREGKCTYRAPIGYLNIGSTDHKPHDPERSKFVTEMFKLYATGDWSLSDIARHVNKQGMITVPMRKRRTMEELLSEEPPTVEPVSRPLTECHISRILTKPFYTGKVLDENGGYIESTSHEALVSEELFNRVQLLLKKKTVSIHYTTKLEHPLRGMIRCAQCHRVYTPYEKKGNLYYGARCQKNCSNTKKSFNFDFISTKIRELLSTLYFSDDELIEFEARTSTGISLLEEKRNHQTEKDERRKKKIRADLAYLRTEQLSLLKSGLYSAEGLVVEREKLEQELDGLINTEEVSEAAIRETMKEVIKVSELLKHTVELYDLANPSEKEQIVKTLISELFIDDKTLLFQSQTGFEAIFDRSLAVCDPIAWLSEHSLNFTLIKTSIKTLEEL